MPRYTVIGLTTSNGRLAIADVHEGACVSLAIGSETHTMDAHGTILHMVRFTHYTVAANAGDAVMNAYRAHRDWYTGRDELTDATAVMSATVTDPGFVDVALPVATVQRQLSMAKLEAAKRELAQRQAPRRPWWRRLLGR